MSQEKPNVGVGPTLGGEGSPCPEVTFGGKTYRVGYPTQKAKQWLEMFVQWHFEQELEASRSILSPQKFAEREEKFLLSIGAGSHRTFGTMWTAVLNQKVLGPTLFLASLLREHAPNTPIGDLIADAKRLWASANPQVRRALAAVVVPFVQALAADSPNPPEAWPALAEGITEHFLQIIGPTTPAPQAPPTN